MPAYKAQTVRTAERALSILETLSHSKRGLTLGQVSQKLSLPRSSTYYLLLTLERCGYVRRNEQTSRFEPGLRLLGLANMFFARLELYEQIKPLLQCLEETSSLTIRVTLLPQDGTVLVEKLIPPGPCAGGDVSQ